MSSMACSRQRQARLIEIQGMCSRQICGTIQSAVLHAHDSDGAAESDRWLPGSYGIKWRLPSRKPHTKKSRALTPGFNAPEIQGAGIWVRGAAREVPSLSDYF